MDLSQYTTSELLAMKAEAEAELESAKAAMKSVVDDDEPTYDPSRELAWNAIREMADTKIENEKLKTALLTKQDTPAWVGDILNQIADVQGKSAASNEAEPAWVSPLVEALKGLKPPEVDSMQITYDDQGRMTGFAEKGTVAPEQPYEKESLAGGGELFVGKQE